MRVVLVNPTFSEHMGYAENCLPPALARLGAEVHLVSGTASPYSGNRESASAYGCFHGSEGLPVGTRQLDGYTLHIRPFATVLGYPRLRGLLPTVRDLQPDVVQSFVPTSWIALELAVAQPLLRYKLFTASHTHASVLPAGAQADAKRGVDYIRFVLPRFVSGRVASFGSERCYALTRDCAEVAVRVYGVPEKKSEISPLGVDTERFTPIVTNNQIRKRNRLRMELGLSEQDIVCIYTGRFTEAKNPLLLANAVGLMCEQGEPFRALFVGDGPQRQRLERSAGCVTHPFIPWRELANFYRASDIGVWPAQESTSMLDAAACAVPIVISNRVKARERVDDNGLMFDHGKVEDLARVLRALRDPAVRLHLGQHGAKKMRERFSWTAIARARLEDYAALAGVGAMPPVDETLPQFHKSKK